MSALFLFMMLLTLASAPDARAASNSGQGAGIEIGQLILLGDFGENFPDGMGFRIRHTYQASPMFGLLTQLHYSTTSNSESTNNLTIAGITPNLKVNLVYFDKIVIYSFGGFGLYKVSEKIGRSEGSVTSFGINLGGGFDLSLSDAFAFGTNISFTNIFGKSAEVDPATGGTSLSIGGTFNALMLSFTYMF